MVRVDEYGSDDHAKVQIQVDYELLVSEVKLH